MTQLQELIVYSAMAVMLVWLSMKTLIDGKRHRKRLLSDGKNQKEHKILSNNQAYLSKEIKTLEILLKKQDQGIRKVELMIIQKLYPLLENESVVQFLKKEIEKLKSQNQVNQEMIQTMRHNADILNQELTKEKEGKK